jgi:ribosomal protein S12
MEQRFVSCISIMYVGFNEHSDVVVWICGGKDIAGTGYKIVEGRSAEYIFKVIEHN